MSTQRTADFWNFMEGRKRDSRLLPVPEPAAEPLTFSRSVLRTMQQRYKETGIVPKVATATLEQLEREGLISITAWAEHRLNNNNGVYIHTERVPVGISWREWL